MSVPRSKEKRVNPKGSNLACFHGNTISVHSESRRSHGGKMCNSGLNLTYFVPFSAHFGQVWAYFGLFWMIMAHFDSILACFAILSVFVAWFCGDFWPILAYFEHSLTPFWPVLSFSGSFWSILDNFCPILPLYWIVVSFLGSLFFLSIVTLYWRWA